MTNDQKTPPDSHYERLRMEIRDSYDRYLKDFGVEPIVAVCQIKWEDDNKHEVVKIKLSEDTNPTEEDDIFFYCGDLAGLCSLVASNGEDFTIVGLEYFE